MQLENLTKKNQEFVHIATNQLIKDGKSDEEIKVLLEEILPSILDGQKIGLTARSLYGPPTEWAASQTPDTSDGDNLPENDNPWLMWVDSSLLIIALLGFVNGAMNLFTQGAQYGILTFIIVGFGVGAGIYFMYHFVYRHMGDGTKRPKIWKAVLMLLLATIAWSVIFFIANMIPTSVNPVLSPIAYLLIAALAFGVRYLLKKKYNIRNAMQPVR
ncbi:membrane protein [Streptococcus varani]|uniref:Membrane protein n=1 Tax=Streptococcus varani TaxID=1608583 RepID=A0A0E4CS80_9STRE|nr:DUF1129 family protein [Streptococcus varani]CQR24342.1 membrane protein [Streptococcus varani]